MAGYLDQQQRRNNLLQTSGYLTSQQPQTDQPPTVAPSEQLYNTARLKEQSMIESAPDRYMDDASLLAGVNPRDVNAHWVQGFRQGREDQRANRSLGMREEAMSYMRTDREKKRMIDEGMAVAAQQGGFEGVIDYLKGTDPDRALEFNSAKLDLDAKIMKNDMYAFLAPIEKEKALIEGYGALGKMGAALLNADPSDRMNMYRTMLPMVKAINPDAPDSLDNNAVGMFMLAAAQATPQNQLFKYENGMMEAESSLGKINNDIAKLQSMGKTPETDPGLRALMAQRDQYTDKADQSKLSLYQTRMMLDNDASTQAQKVFQSTETTNKTLAQTSSRFSIFADNYVASKTAIDNLKKNPHDAISQMSLSRNLAKALNGGGVMTDADAAAVFMAYGVRDWQKRLASWSKGEKTILDKKEQEAIINLYETTAKQQLSKQLDIESQFKASADQYGNLVNWKAVRLPSQTLQNMLPGSGTTSTQQRGAQLQQQTAPAEAVQEAISNPKLLPQFIEYFGYDPTQPQQQQPVQGR